MIYTRLSTAQMIQNGLEGVYKNQRLLNDSMTALSTGKRNDLDPVEKAQLLSYKVSISNNAQNNRNIENITPKLQDQESSLSQISENMKALSDMAVKLGNTMNSEQKQIFKAEYDSLKSNILNQLNAKDYLGEYKFSGWQSRVTPFDNEFNYQSDQGVSSIRTGNNTTVELNVPGDRVITNNFRNAIAKLDNYFDSSATKVNTAVLDDLRLSQEDISIQITKVGNKLNQLDLSKEYNQDIIDSNTEKVSSLEDADMVKAAADFAKAQAAYQASLKTQSIIQSTSLFDYI